MVNFFFTKYMANDAFSETPRRADANNAIFIFWVRVTSGAQGSVSVGFWGGLQSSPFFFWVGGVQPEDCIDPLPPQTKARPPIRQFISVWGKKRGGYVMCPYNSHCMSGSLLVLAPRAWEVTCSKGRRFLPDRPRDLLMALPSLSFLRSSGVPEMTAQPPPVGLQRPSANVRSPSVTVRIRLNAWAPVFFLMKLGSAGDGPRVCRRGGDRPPCPFYCPKRWVPLSDGREQTTPMPPLASSQASTPSLPDSSGAAALLLWTKNRGLNRSPTQSKRRPTQSKRCPMQSKRRPTQSQRCPTQSERCPTPFKFSPTQVPRPLTQESCRNAIFVFIFARA